MSRGFGHLQRRVLSVLQYENDRGREWCDVGSLLFQVINGNDCWNRTINDPILPDLVETERQAIWRAIRSLEKRGLLESRKVHRGYRERTSYNRGGISHAKEVCLSV